MTGPAARLDCLHSSRSVALELRAEPLSTDSEATRTRRMALPATGVMQRRNMHRILQAYMNAGLRLPVPLATAAAPCVSSYVESGRPCYARLPSGLSGLSRYALIRLSCPSRMEGEEVCPLVPCLPLLKRAREPARRRHVMGQEL